MLSTIPKRKTVGRKKSYGGQGRGVGGSSFLKVLYVLLAISSLASSVSTALLTMGRGTSIAVVSPLAIFAIVVFLLGILLKNKIGKAGKAKILPLIGLIVLVVAMLLGFVLGSFGGGSGIGSGIGSGGNKNPGTQNGYEVVYGGETFDDPIYLDDRFESTKEFAALDSSDCVWFVLNTDGAGSYVFNVSVYSRITVYDSNRIQLYDAWSYKLSCELTEYTYYVCVRPEEDRDNAFSLSYFFEPAESEPTEIAISRGSNKLPVSGENTVRLALESDMDGLFAIACDLACDYVVNISTNNYTLIDERVYGDDRAIIIPVTRGITYCVEYTTTSGGSFGKNFEVDVQSVGEMESGAYVVSASIYDGECWMQYYPQRDELLLIGCDNAAISVYDVDGKLVSTDSDGVSTSVLYGYNTYYVRVVASDTRVDRVDLDTASICYEGEMDSSFWVNFSGDKDMMAVKFVPDRGGIYQFYTESSSLLPYLSVMDGENGDIRSYYEDRNVTTYLAAGKTYYLIFESRDYDSDYALTVESTGYYESVDVGYHTVHNNSSAISKVHKFTAYGYGRYEVMIFDNTGRGGAIPKIEIYSDSGMLLMSTDSGSIDLGYLNNGETVYIVLKYPEDISAYSDMYQLQIFES